MEIINNASITTERDGLSTETFMASYSPEEQEQNQINASNAQLVYSPEFIPFYRSIQIAYGLTDKETLVYGFIRFYMSTSQNKRFYFTDKQLAEVVGCGEDKAQGSIKKLKEVNLITASTKIRAGGGKVRFITGVRILSNTPFGILEKAGINNNKIKENNINITNVSDSPKIGSSPEYERNSSFKVKLTYKNINILKDMFKEVYPKDLRGFSDDKYLRSFWLLSQPRKNKDAWMSESPWDNIRNFLQGYIKSKGKKFVTGKMYELNLELKDWRERGGIFNLTAEENEQTRD